VDPYPVSKGQVAPSLEDELGRSLARVPARDRSAYARGFRAAWAVCLERFQPIVGDWEARWWRLVAENSRLRARIGLLLTEISRLNDRG
jgi:hypothetical protein